MYKRNKKGQFVKGSYVGFGFKKDNRFWRLRGKAPIGMRGKKHSSKSRKKISQSIKAYYKRTGNHSPSWKGGKYKTWAGYIRIYKPNYPSANTFGYVLGHRLIMEKILHRYLTKKEQVHHINGIKDDNRPENLELVIRKAHYGKIECPYCERKFKIR